MQAALRDKFIPYPKAYLTAATGFGKTEVANLIVKHCLKTDPSRVVHVVVPTKPLKEQWERRVAGVEVFVVNTYVKEPRECFFLIIDEGYNYLNEEAKVFNKVFNTRYSAILALAPSYSEAEVSFMQNKGMRELANISMDVARRNGWISQFQQVNVAIDISAAELARYESVYKSDQGAYAKLLACFDYDYSLAMKCSGSLIPLMWRDVPNDPFIVRFARSKGWNGPTPQWAMNQKNQGVPNSRIWGPENHPYHPNVLMGKAVQFIRLVASRKTWIYDHPLKLEATARILQAEGRKAITFGQTTSGADKIVELIGYAARAYHTAVEGEIETFTREKVYKTLKGATAWSDKVRGVVYQDEGRYVVSWGDQRNLSPSTVLQQTLRDFNEDLFTYLCTATALDEGYDQQDILLGVCYARTANPRQTIQRMGRIVRLLNGESKDALYVNVYLKGTQDEAWLKKSQAKQRGIRNFDSVDQFLAWRTGEYKPLQLSSI